MISVIFRAKMRPGKEDEAIAKMRAMAESVQAGEPGALIYAFHRPQDDPSEIVFWEAYADEEAFKGHMGTAHMNEMRGFFPELFEPASAKIERLDRVAGFVRTG